MIGAVRPNTAVECDALHAALRASFGAPHRERSAYTKRSMSTKSTNSGFCALCGLRATKTTMMAHVETCVAAHDKIGQPQSLIVLPFRRSRRPPLLAYHRGQGERGIASLGCLVAPTLAGMLWTYERVPSGRRELAMTTATAIAFTRAASKVEYEYDFGSTTALTGELVCNRQGSIGRASVRLLARNEPLVWPCGDCKAPASVVCLYCIDSDNGFFCDAHAEMHEHAGEKVYLPVVNSPRMGVCGYSG